MRMIQRHWCELWVSRQTSGPSRSNERPAGRYWPSGQVGGRKRLLQAALRRERRRLGTSGRPTRARSAGQAGSGLLESAQLLVAMKYVLAMSPSTCAASIEVKPASLSISRAFCSPHIVPRPIPPSARETVMQCMHETV